MQLEVMFSDGSFLKLKSQKNDDLETSSATEIWSQWKEIIKENKVIHLKEDFENFQLSLLWSKDRFLEIVELSTSGEHLTISSGNITSHLKL